MIKVLRPIQVAIALAVLSLASLGSDGKAETPADVQRQPLATFQRSVWPLLETHCTRCHGEKKQEGNVRFDRLDPDMAAGEDGETWHDALNKLNLGEMPPEGERQMESRERSVLVNWLTEELKRAAAVRRSTGGRVVIRRLTRYEYANTLRDLLGIDVDFATDLPAEPNSPDKLKNNGSSLTMSPQQLEMYVDIAQNAIAKAIVTGDEPEVFRHSSNGAGNGKGLLHPPNAGLIDFRDYPMEGEFRIRVQASVQGSTDDQVATLRVVMGVRPSPKNLKTEDVGQVRVSANGDNPQTFEFRGRMENFPLHDPRTAYRERRYPGLQIGFWNDTYDQLPAQLKKSRDKRQQSAETQPDAKGPVLTVHSVSYEAPVFEAWPPAHHTRILFPSELAETDERQYARNVLQQFMRRAFRRPVTDDEVEQKLEVYDAWRTKLPSLELAMRVVLPEILVSHHFLYLVEPTDGNQKIPLTDHELAARLSYFLWSTMPDGRLFELAEAGTLGDSQTLAEQVRMMLEHKRSWNFVENFTDQWLDLSGVSRIAVNPDYYPDFDDRLKDDMRKETQHFFAEILRNDLSAMNLLDSDFTMLNRSLAEHYGIEGPQDNTFVRTALKPEDHRGGLLGQASILLVNSSGDDSHPIYRGVFIRDRLLGDTPASPPPDVPELDKDDPELASLSLRQQLEVHRKKESCNSCHRNIDPWGIPLESFDAVGRWRTEVRRSLGDGVPPTFKNGVVVKKRQQPKFAMVLVETSATLPDGSELDGIEGLKAHLLQHEQRRFAEAFVRRLLAYSLGRSLELVDDDTVASLLKTFEESNYQIDELIVAITQSEPFQTK